MYLLISFSPTRRSAAEDTATRLRVLFPSIKISIREDALELSNIPPDQADEIAQAASDQLLRSRYAQDTSSLRDRLYARLLG
tara:strand:- start:86 stop:331 length:246 start_codon:yes stop_codon:yes gene_type:complete